MDRDFEVYWLQKTSAENEDVGASVETLHGDSSSQLITPQASTETLMAAPALEEVSTPTLDSQISVPMRCENASIMNAEITGENGAREIPKISDQDSQFPGQRTSESDMNRAVDPDPQPCQAVPQIPVPALPAMRSTPQQSTQQHGHDGEPPASASGPTVERALKQLQVDMDPRLLDVVRGDIEAFYRSCSRRRGSGT